MTKLCLRVGTGKAGGGKIDRTGIGRSRASHSPGPLESGGGRLSGLGYRSHYQSEPPHPPFPTSMSHYFIYSPTSLHSHAFSPLISLSHPFATNPFPPFPYSPFPHPSPLPPLPAILPPPFPTPPTPILPCLYSYTPLPHLPSLLSYPTLTTPPLTTLPFLPSHPFIPGIPIVITRKPDVKQADLILGPLYSLLFCSVS